MGLRIVYKDGKEFACNLAQANKMVETEGWSWTNSAPATPSKTSAKPKKAKVKVKADAVKVDSPFNDGEPLNIDLGEIENNSKENE